jgi:hypothetical protein
MKNLFIVLVAMTLFSCTAKQPKDDRLLFSIKIKSGQKYTIETLRTSDMEVKYVGGEKALNKLRSMGIKNPNVLSRKIQTESVLTTENILDKTYIPVKLEIIRSNSSDGRLEIPEGIVANGESKGGEMPGFSSIQSGKRDGRNEESLLESIQNIFSQLNLPEKNLKVGEQFTTESTLTIPMEKSHVEIAVTTTYKLVSVTNDQAGFDILQNYAMNQMRMDNSFNGTGGGKGKLTYDVGKSMVSFFEMNSNLEMNKKLENFVFTLKTKSGFVQKIAVSKK